MHVCMLQILYFDRTKVSEGIDINKTSESKECDVCYYWYVSNKRFKFQPNVCNRCHDLLMMCTNSSDIAILEIKGSDYSCINSLISKNEAINLMQNADVTEKRNIIKHEKIIIIYKNRSRNFNVWWYWKWKK